MEVDPIHVARWLSRLVDCGLSAYQRQMDARRGATATYLDDPTPAERREAMRLAQRVAETAYGWAGMHLANFAAHACGPPEDR